MNETEALEFLEDLRENHVIIEVENYERLVEQIYNKARDDLEEEQYGNDRPYRHKPSANYAGQVGAGSARVQSVNEGGSVALSVEERMKQKEDT